MPQGSGSRLKTRAPSPWEHPGVSWGPIGVRRLPDPPASDPGRTANAATSSTPELLARIHGDEEARDTLVRRYLPDVRRWASGRLPLARDCAARASGVERPIPRRLAAAQGRRSPGEIAARDGGNGVRDQDARTGLVLQDRQDLRAGALVQIGRGLHAVGLDAVLIGNAAAALQGARDDRGLRLPVSQDTSQPPEAEGPGRAAARDDPATVLPRIGPVPPRPR